VKGLALAAGIVAVTSIPLPVIVAGLSLTLAAGVAFIVRSIRRDGAR
jgi:hypothetical protein